MVLDFERPGLSPLLVAPSSSGALERKGSKSVASWLAAPQARIQLPCDFEVTIYLFISLLLTSGSTHFFFSTCFRGAGDVQFPAILGKSRSCFPQR